MAGSNVCVLHARVKVIRSKVIDIAGLNKILEGFLSKPIFLFAEKKPGHAGSWQSFKTIQVAFFNEVELHWLASFL